MTAAEAKLLSATSDNDDLRMARLVTCTDFAISSEAKLGRTSASAYLVPEDQHLVQELRDYYENLDFVVSTSEQGRLVRVIFNW